MKLCTFCKTIVHATKYETTNKILELRMIVSFKRINSNATLYVCPLCLRKFLRDLVDTIEKIK